MPGKTLYCLGEAWLELNSPAPLASAKTFSPRMGGSAASLALAYTGYNGTDFTVYHRLYDVCNITVVSDKNTVGYYDMNSKITVQTYEGTNICRK